MSTYTFYMYTYNVNRLKTIYALEKTCGSHHSETGPRLSCAKKDRRWPTPLWGLPGMGCEMMWRF